MITSRRTLLRAGIGLAGAALAIFGVADQAFADTSTDERRPHRRRG